MKKLLFTILIALACASSVTATDVTVSSSQQSNLPFNPANIGTSIQSITVTTTNGSSTVTSSAFPSNIVGRAGFQVLFSGSDSTQYVVSGVTSSTSLTLTTPFAGTTGSKTMTLYKFVILRVYCNQAFTPLNANYVVQAGAIGSASFYKEVAVSVINTGSGNVAWYPEFTIPATTDAPLNNTSQYTFAFYNASGGYLNALYTCDGGITQLSVPPSTPTSFINLCSYNGAVAIRPDASTYTRTQIDARFPSCTAGQMIYYAVTGNAQACLSVGSGLSISAGTITATGGAASLPTATQTSTNYTILNTDWLVAVNASGASRTATLPSAASNSNKIIQVCKIDTSVNTVTISDGSSNIAVIYSPESCIQVISTGTLWRIQSF